MEESSPASQTPELPEGLFRAQVLEPGYVSFKLNHGITVNIGPNYAIQIINEKMSSKLALSGCATQMALVHPQGRILQYNARIEVQCPGLQWSANGYKSAKIWPRGISFTSTKSAITYLVDEAGTRSTSDYFFNLFHQDNTDCKTVKVNFELFRLIRGFICFFPGILTKSCDMFNEAASHIDAISKSLQILENVEHWQAEDKTNVWIIDDCVLIQQTEDGYVRYGTF